jgi:hypothetical protein
MVTGTIGKCDTKTKIDYIKLLLVNLSDKINNFTDDHDFELKINELIGGVNCSTIESVGDPNIIVVVTQAALIEENQDHGFLKLK